MNNNQEWDWQLSALDKIAKNNCTVFSCFSGGGGSSMGYKLAGFNVLGGVEIDQQMINLYQQNLKPKHAYLMDIRKFNQIENNQLPEQLFNLDILDGSPPCSSFSLAGDRDKNWGKAKKFREGQAKQQLDDLFFDYLDTVEKLEPKIVVAENVKGLIQGKAKGFVKLIINRFKQLGYKVQLFLLNAATMGVPQRRERVFFIAHRKELNYQKLKLEFNEKPILYKQIRTGKGSEIARGTKTRKRWYKMQPSDNSFGDITNREEGKMSGFNTSIVRNNKVPYTITSGGEFIRSDEPYRISDLDIVRISTFPKDYNFLNASVKYVCGMSVPPVMTKKIAQQIYEQWLNQ